MSHKLPPPDRTVTRFCHGHNKLAPPSHLPEWHCPCPCGRHAHPVCRRHGRCPRVDVGRACGRAQRPQPTSASVLSEHHLEVLDAMAPQAQAEFLIERAINRYRGSNEQIAARVAGWHGRID